MSRANFLRHARFLLVLVAAPACVPQAGPAAAAPACLAPDHAPFLALEIEVHRLINRQRTRGLLPDLVLDARVAAVARRHSLAMAAGERPVGHGFLRQRVGTLFPCIGVIEAYENVTVFQSSRSTVPLIAVQNWLDSPPHRANVFRRHDTTGVGIILGEDGNYYITQIYLRTR